MGKNKDNTEKKIQESRDLIDTLDEQIVKLIIKRISLSSQIGEYKKSQNLPVYNKEREEQIINRVIEIAKKDNFTDTKYIENIYKTIIEESKKIQNI